MPSPIRPARTALVVLALLVTGVGLAPAASAARPAPSRPGPLTVSSVSQTGAVVDFGRSRGSGRVKYRILANGHKVATTRRTTGVRVKLRCGTTYLVTAVAVNRAGRRSKPSPGANLRTRACLDRTPPSTPAHLRASGVDDSSVTLSWDGASDPGNGPVPGYLVYRDGVVLGGSTSGSFRATHLRASTSYGFSVRSRDRAGNLSAPQTLTVSTARPVQATGDARAYVLTTDGVSFADAQRHYTQLERVFPTFFSLTRTGDVTGTGQPSLTTWFQDRGVDVMPRFHSEDLTVIESVLTDPVRRTHGAEEVARVVAVGGYDGANLDLELSMPSTGVGDLTKQQRWDRLRSGYSDFVDQVGALLHADGRLLSVAVSPNWCSSVDPQTRETRYCTNSASSSTVRSRAYLFDYRSLAQSADELFVMSWGLHWASSDSGPMADLRWLEAVTDYYTDLFRDRPEVAGRLTLGTNLYGMDWSERVVRTDRIAYPGTPMPLAPACTGPSTTARARTSYEGTPGSGTLVVDWVCLSRYAETAEYDHVMEAAPAFTATRYDAASAENVMTGPDASTPGATRVVWFPDATTVGERVALVDAVDWHVGFWRLGREDQRIWALPGLAAPLARSGS